MKKNYVAFAWLALLLWFGSVSASAGTLVVGGKNFTEQLLLSSMTAQYLRSKGYEVELKNGLGSTLMRTAQESGQLDVVWEYTGTSLIVYNHVDAKLDEAASYALVKQLDDQLGLVWLDESGLNNTYAFAMSQQLADELHINTLDDLAAYFRRSRQQGDSEEHLVGVDYEFASRPDGLGPMQQLYDFELDRSELRQMDSGLVYTALRNQQLFAGLTYSSDGRIKGFGLKLLEDNKGYFAAYKATPVVRKEVLEQNPQLASQLNALAAVIDTEKMTELNRRVDIGQEPVSQVVADFLQQQGLL